MWKTLLFAGMSLLALSAHAVLLEDGNYHLSRGHSSCDIHIDTNASAAKVYLTPISNQQSGEYCDDQETVVYNCNSASRCAIDLSKEESKQIAIEIINEKNFLSGDDKYTFSNNNPIVPAKLYASKGYYGFIATDAHSFTQDTRCAFFTEQGTYTWCDDVKFAKDVFCPEARKLAVEEALDNCQAETGKECKVTSEEEFKITNEFTRTGYNQNLMVVEYIATLSCEANVVATP